MVVCSELGLPPEVLNTKGLQGKLIGRLAAEAQDPDLAAAQWMDTTVPLGINEPIAPGGVFPLLSQEEAQHNISRYAPPDLKQAALGNYQSYEEAKDLADEEIAK